MRSRDGKGSFLKNPSGTYKVRFIDEQNIRRSINIKTVTERDFLLRCIRRQEELDQWFPVDSAVQKSTVSNFKDLSEKFLDHRASVREVAESTLKNYRAQLNHHILPLLGTIKVNDLSIRDIEALAKKLKETKPKTRPYLSIRKGLFDEGEFLSSAYRREILTLACTVSKFGFLRDYMKDNPFKAFELPECCDQPYDYWRPDEEDKFLDWLESGGSYQKPHRNKLMVDYIREWQVWNHKKVYEVVLFALRTGMRKGEITSLSMDHVSFSERLITVQSTWSFKGKKLNNQTKNGGFRRIEMNDDVYDILLQYKDYPGDFRPFYSIMRSHTIKNFSKLTKLAGVREIHFHALRHTFLTNLANGIGMDEPVDIMKVKELAGHSDIKTTMIYVHSIGVKNTSSLQWSRSERKANLEKVIPIKRKEAKR